MSFYRVSMIGLERLRMITRSRVVNRLAAMNAPGVLNLASGSKLALDLALQITV